MNDRMQQTTLTDDQRKNILDKYGEMDSYFSMIKTELGKKKEYEDTGFNIDEVHHKYDTFKQQVNQIFTQPPPKPQTAPPTTNNNNNTTE